MNATDIISLPIFDGNPKVLDFGCGYGNCIPVWETKCNNVVGYDPNYSVFSKLNDSHFDVVIMKHIITIADTIWSVAAKIAEAASYLNIGGYLCIVIGNMIDFQLIRLIVQTAENGQQFDIEIEHKNELLVAKKLEV